MGTERFYRDLSSFSNFNDLVGDLNFHPLPRDWMIIVADIQGSTKAIEEGRYKDVNILGAATIVAAQNAMAKEDFPYVFGGDGATLIVPPDALEKVGAALDGVRALAREKFGMALRVGAVGAAELYAEGHRIEVAKFELFAGRSIALFRGGGLPKAEERIKGDIERYSVKERPEHASDLTGLSCRWNPIRSERGKVLSLLVSARSRDPKAAYQEVLRGLDAILNGSIRTANPVKLSNMGYRSILNNLKSERRYHASAFSIDLLKRTAGIIFSVMVFKWKLPQTFFDARHYADALCDHSDFRKFDDLLRMVVDCSARQISEIRALLEGLRLKGDIHYGLHESDQALMTCFVYSADDGGHIHFIDGGDGGYAMAAKQLKAQMKAAGPAKRPAAPKDAGAGLPGRLLARLRAWFS